MVADGEPLGLGDPVGVVLAEVLGEGDGLCEEEMLGDGLLLGEVLCAGELARQLRDACAGERRPTPLD
jgi:hypothetical protein